MAVRKNRPKAGKRAVKLPKKPNPLMREVIAIVMIAVGILLALAFFVPHAGGVFGVFVHDVFRGLFGFGAYVLPFIIAGVGMYLFFVKAALTMPQIVMLALIFLCVTSFAFLRCEDAGVVSDSFMAYIKYYYDAGAVSNGGLLGAVFGNALIHMLGKAGAYVTLTAAALILLILLSGKSMYKLIAAISAYISDLVAAREWEAYEEETDEADAGEDMPQRPYAGVRRRAEAPLFTIEDEGGRHKKRVELVSESLEKGAKKTTVLKDASGKKVTEIVDMDQVENIAHPVMSDINIQVHGLVDNEEYFPVDEVFVQTSAMDGETLEAEDEAVSIKEYTVIKPEGKEAARPTDFGAATEQYTPPPIGFLNENPAMANLGSRAQILENSKKLEETLRSFGVEAKVIEVSKGPTVTRYELSPGHGVKVSKISGLADDLALNLAAQGIRIEAPIPGKAAVGIEVPNKEVTPVFLREVLDDEAFINFPSKLAFALGKDIAGNTVVADIAKMPHLLIAGATGSGKSVCVNTLITSLIYKANPDEVKLLMIDPKVVELGIYNGIPHLLIPVVTDPKKAAGALNWAVQEMVTRYNLFAETSVRDLKGYNAYVKEHNEGVFLPQIVIIIDELADLMMVAPGEVEDAICRLAQMARAAGLHLIIATQRPSVDVITGLIKANIPSRLAFSVSSGIDSRTILDMVGAERLLGRGDMLFNPVGMGKPLRVQGAFVSDKEVENIVNFVKKGREQEYDQEMIDKITAAKTVDNAEGEKDEFFEPAVEFLVHKEKASASLLQRQFRIGYNRASRLIEDLEARGIVGPEDGSKPRKVLMTSMQWAQWKENQRE